jgi:BirA family biotin operon repressor/biotin-[acetyl-CoA-carboxylase] ligase
MDRAPLDGPRLRAALTPRWSRVQVVDETASTNADLLADSAAPDRSVLVAEHQVSGRGRFDRVWTSPPRAGLTFSVRLRPTVPLPHWGWLPLLTGLALREAVEASTGVATALKWPNDLLAAPNGGKPAPDGKPALDGKPAPDGGKLAGILAQTAGDVVVVGIGLNVDTSADELPTETATSLALTGAVGLDRTDLLTAILTRLDARYAQWSDCGGDAAACGLAAAYRDACSTIGRTVRVAISATGNGGDLVGEAIGVDEIGRLIVRTPAGEQPVGAGDVEHLRPA